MPQLPMRVAQAPLRRISCSELPQVPRLPAFAPAVGEHVEDTRERLADSPGSGRATGRGGLERGYQMSALSNQDEEAGGGGAAELFAGRL